jgi:hypothetical protein
VLSCDSPQPRTPHLADCCHCVGRHWWRHKAAPHQPPGARRLVCKIKDDGHLPGGAGFERVAAWAAARAAAAAACGACMRRAKSCSAIGGGRDCSGAGAPPPAPTSWRFSGATIAISFAAAPGGRPAAAAAVAAPRRGRCCGASGGGAAPHAPRPAARRAAAASAGGALPPAADGTTRHPIGARLRVKLAIRGREPWPRSPGRGLGAGLGE